jgi:hypothetical protein
MTDVNITGNAELREYWGNLASNFLVGKTIRRVRYLTDREREDIAWDRSGLVIEFEDGHWLLLCVMMRVMTRVHYGRQANQN